MTFFQFDWICQEMKWKKINKNETWEHFCNVIEKRNQLGGHNILINNNQRISRCKQNEQEESFKYWTFHFFVPNISLISFDLTVWVNEFVFEFDISPFIHSLFTTASIQLLLYSLMRLFVLFGKFKRFILFTLRT